MTREDVINKVFPHSLFGYDPVAVDAFLDEVIREFDRLTNTVDVLQFRLAQELSEAKQTNDMLAAELSHADFSHRVEQLIAGSASFSAEHSVPFEAVAPVEPSDEPEEEAAEVGEEAPETPEASEEHEEAEEPLPDYDPNADFDPEIDVGPEPARIREAEAASAAFEQALERETGVAADEPPEEIVLMSRSQIRKMVRDEKRLERRVRRQKKKAKK